MAKATRQKTRGLAKPKRKASKNRNQGSLLSQATGIQYGKGMNINLYGDSATGKTTFWATFPGPILALLCSGGDNPGELISIDTPEYRKKIKQLVITESGQVSIVAQELAESSQETIGYKTVVLDHLTGLQDLVMSEILGIKKMPEQLSWGVAQRDQWAQGASQVKTHLRALFNLRELNVVVVAQQRTFERDGSPEDEEIPTTKVASAVMPSIANWLYPACDYICQTYLRQKTERKKIMVGGKKKETVKKVKGQFEYCLRTSPSTTFVTKVRAPKGSSIEDIVDPSYEKLMARVKGES
jgi:hypothetical protein